MNHLPIEARMAQPVETREGDPLAAAVQAVDELRTASEQHRTQLDERVTTEMRGITDRIAGLETRLNRPGVQTTAEDREYTERRALNHYLRRFGTAAYNPEETRALNTSDEGALVPEVMQAEIIKAITEFSPMRELARITNVTGNSVKLPRRLTKPSAGIKAEGESATGSESTYGNWTIPIYEIREFTDVSNELLEDAGFDMGAEITADLAEAFGETEGDLFFTGTGTDEPLGLLADPAFVTTTAADIALDPDELIDLFYGVKTSYSRRGAWAMNRQTIAGVRKLKSSTSGEYLWADSLTDGQPPTFLGKPVVEVPALGDIEADSVVAVFGDWNRGFRILDRLGMSILRDPYSRSANGQVRFHGRRRVGGKLVQPEALVGLKMPAA